MKNAMFMSSASHCSFRERSFLQPWFPKRHYREASATMGLNETGAGETHHKELLAGQSPSLPINVLLDTKSPPAIPSCSVSFPFLLNMPGPGVYPLTIRKQEGLFNHTEGTPMAAIPWLVVFFPLFPFSSRILLGLQPLHYSELPAGDVSAPRVPFPSCNWAWEGAQLYNKPSPGIFFVYISTAFFSTPDISFPSSN